MDFGLATGAASKKGQLHSTLPGVGVFQPPEIGLVRPKRYTTTDATKGDVWSAGVLLFAMLSKLKSVPSNAVLQTFWLGFKLPPIPMSNSHWASSETLSPASPKNPPRAPRGARRLKAYAQRCFTNFGVPKEAEIKKFCESAAWKHRLLTKLCKVRSSDCLLCAPGCARLIIS